MVVGNSAMPVAIAAVSASLIVMGIAAVMRLRRGSGFELCCCMSPCIAWKTALAAFDADGDRDGISGGEASAPSTVARNSGENLQALSLALALAGGKFVTSL